MASLSSAPITTRRRSGILDTLFTLVTYGAIGTIVIRLLAAEKRVTELENEVDEMKVTMTPLPVIPPPVSSAPVEPEVVTLEDDEFRASEEKDQEDSRVMDVTGEEEDEGEVTGEEEDEGEVTGEEEEEEEAPPSPSRGPSPPPTAPPHRKSRKSGTK